MHASNQVDIPAAQLFATLDAMAPVAPALSYEQVAVQLFKALTPEAMSTAAALIPSASCDDFLKRELIHLHRRYAQQMFGRMGSAAVAKAMGKPTVYEVVA